MAITAIQPITNFSTILPATAISPPEVVSIASDFVTTPTTSAVVTLGTARPAFQPLFDSTGQLVSAGSFRQTPQSQALADELARALNPPTTGNASNAGNAAALARLEFDLLMFEMNLLNSSSLIGSNLLNAGLGTGTTDFSGVLATEVELAIAGIGTGSGANAASGVLNPNAIAIVNTVATAPATPTTIRTGATIAPATVPAAVAPPAVAPIVTAPPAIAPPATVPAATAPPAIAPLTTLATTPAPAAGTTTPAAGNTVPGNTAADVLQRLVADVTGRAAANLIDPGFAATSASLFASAAIFRASGTAATPGLGTADIAGTPAPAVTAAQPARPV